MSERRTPWAPATQRRVYQGAGQHGISRRGEPPGQHAPRVLVQYHREVPPPTGDAEICEVAHPDLVDAARLRPSYTIRMLAEPSMGAGRAPIDPHHACAHPALAHEPFHPSTTDPVATCGSA